MDALYTAVATANGREGRAVSSDGQHRPAARLAPRLSAATARAPTPSSSSPPGYAACFASAMGAIGRQEKIDVKDVSVTAEVSIGKDATDGGFGLAVIMRVELPDHLQGDAGRDLLEKTHAVLPVLQGDARQPRRSSSSSSDSPAYAEGRTVMTTVRPSAYPCLTR